MSFRHVSVGTDEVDVEPRADIATADIITGLHSRTHMSRHGSNAHDDAHVDAHACAQVDA